MERSMLTVSRSLRLLVGMPATRARLGCPLWVAYAAGTATMTTSRPFTSIPAPTCSSPRWRAVWKELARRRSSCGP